MRVSSLPWDIHTIEWQQQVKGGNEKLQQFHDHTVLFPENMRAQSLHIIILPIQYLHVLASSTEIVVQWDSYNYTLLSVVQCKHTIHLLPYKLCNYFAITQAQKLLIGQKVHDYRKLSLLTSVLICIAQSVNYYTLQCKLVSENVVAFSN